MIDRNARAVSRDGLYPLADEVPAGWDAKLTAARWTGEHRPPRKGEWFLSGAIVEAYRSLSDPLNPRRNGGREPQSHFIAELVRGRVVWDRTDPPAPAGE